MREGCLAFGRGTSRAWLRGVNKECGSSFRTPSTRIAFALRNHARCCSRVVTHRSRALALEKTPIAGKFFRVLRTSGKQPSSRKRRRARRLASWASEGCQKDACHAFLRAGTNNNRARCANICSLRAVRKTRKSPMNSWGFAQARARGSRTRASQAFQQRLAARGTSHALLLCSSALTNEVLARKSATQHGFVRSRLCRATRSERQKRVAEKSQIRTTTGC